MSPYEHLIQFQGFSNISTMNEFKKHQAGFMTSHTMKICLVHVVSSAIRLWLFLRKKHQAYSWRGPTLPRIYSPQIGGLI